MIKLNIGVKISDKIARPIDKNSVIICGNSDYVIEFDFDEEWDNYPTKTARFSIGTEYIDIAFTGNKCSVPLLRNVFFVKVGVFTGDLITTTPAVIPCKKSITCEQGEAMEFPEGGYSEVAYRDFSNVEDDVFKQKAISSGVVEEVITNIPNGGVGASAYEIAVKNGFEGTETEWLVSLQGKDGYTPKKGTDYWTDDDIDEIKSYVDDAILGGAW